MTMFSFHPVKSITTGEGGAIMTNNEEFYKTLLIFRTHGMTKDSEKLQDKMRAAWHQEMQMLGNNYRLTDIQAALGVSQIKKLNRFVAKRKKLAANYHKLLKNIPGLILPAMLKDIESAWHLFVVRLAPALAKKRDPIFTKLREKGIGVQVHYLPVYLHPYYAQLGYRKGLCPKTETFSDVCLSIPLFPTLTARDQSFVVKTLTAILKEI
jgi:dTDP-4-amino-4,6-dideoxygalactose transaminase